jgi:hypothetical protein
MYHDASLIQGASWVQQNGALPVTEGLSCFWDGLAPARATWVADGSSERARNTVPYQSEGVGGSWRH